MLENRILLNIARTRSLYLAGVGSSEALPDCCGDARSSGFVQLDDNERRPELGNDVVGEYVQLGTLAVAQHHAVSQRQLG
jgi:hypothetical protein